MTKRAKDVRMAWPSRQASYEYRVGWWWVVAGANQTDVECQRYRIGVGGSGNERRRRAGSGANQIAQGWQLRICLALLLCAPTGQTKVAQGNALGTECAKDDEP